MIEFFGTVLVWLDTQRINARNPPDGWVIGDKRGYEAWYYHRADLGFALLLLGFYCKAHPSRLNSTAAVFDCRMVDDPANMSSTIPEFLVWPMKNDFRLITAVVIALALVSSAVAEAGRSRPLDEDAALALLVRTVKQDRAFAKRISLDCVSYGTEETTNAYFEFVLREIHNAKCGGDPVLSHVLDRYRVYRRSGKIELYQLTDDSWHRYDPAKIK